jgi:hypothetical protein
MEFSRCSSDLGGSRGTCPGGATLVLYAVDPLTMSIP